MKIELTISHGQSRFDITADNPLKFREKLKRIFYEGFYVKKDRVLTDSGVDYLEDLCDAFADSDASSKEMSAVANRFGLERVNQSHRNNVGRIPSKSPSYGNILECTDRNHVVKCRYQNKDRFAIHKPERTKGERGQRYYLNENFGEARTWLEACKRGQEHLFAPVTAYDNENFRWLVMQEVSPESWSWADLRLGNSVYHPVQDYFKRVQKAGWYPFDSELGWLKGDLVAFDYGHYWRADEDWLVAEEVVKNLEWR